MRKRDMAGETRLERVLRLRRELDGAERELERELESSERARTGHPLRLIVEPDAPADSASAPAEDADSVA
jgi:hypothetical protein